MQKERNHLLELIQFFKNTDSKFNVLRSETPIQAIIIPGNEEVKSIAEICRGSRFDVRPILYPTVPKGKERLRIVLHAFNTFDEIKSLLRILK